MHGNVVCPLALHIQPGIHCGGIGIEGEGAGQEEQGEKTTDKEGGTGSFRRVFERP